MSEQEHEEFDDVHEDEEVPLFCSVDGCTDIIEIDFLHDPVCHYCGAMVCAECAQHVHNKYCVWAPTPVA